MRGEQHYAAKRTSEMKTEASLLDLAPGGHGDPQ